MTEEEETADTSADGQKSSKRDRLRGAISRTKSKFKKHDDKSQGDEFNLPEDVNQFLQAGRPSTAESINPDALPQHPSPRRVQVPRIDVSSSQRWPSQRAVDADESGGLLRPEYQMRSQSQGSLRPRRKDRPRNLSVAFLDAPPVVIGEGGDEAEKPPIEIARARARSVSPMPHARRGTAAADGHSPVRRKPLPEQIEPRAHGSPEELMPGRRQFDKLPGGITQTIIHESKSAFDREFDMTLQPGSTPVSPEQHVSPSSNAAQPKYLPEPQVSPTSAPLAQRPSHEPTLKSTTASDNLRMQFEEGQALREGHSRDPPGGDFISHSQPNAPDPRQLQQLSLVDTSGSFMGRKDIFSPTRPDSGKEGRNPEGWI